MTWIIARERVPTSHWFVLILSNIFTGCVSWGVARWYYKAEVIYSNLTPTNMIFASLLTVTVACLVGAAHSEPPRDAWHDEEIIESVRELRRNIQTRMPEPCVRFPSTYRHANAYALDEELIAAGYDYTFRDFFPATRNRKIPTYYAVRRGRKTGIFPNWEEAQAQVECFHHNDHMSFRKYEDAANWLLGRLTMPDVRG